MVDLDRMLEGRPARRTQTNVTATVTAVEADGVYVVALDDDNRHPVGPCLGAWRRNADGVVEQLPVGTTVLLIHTDSGPWVAAWEEPGEET